MNGHFTLAKACLRGLKRMMYAWENGFWSSSGRGHKLCFNDQGDRSSRIARSAIRSSSGMVEHGDWWLLLFQITEFHALSPQSCSGSFAYETTRFRAGSHRWRWIMGRNWCPIGQINGSFIECRIWQKRKNSNLAEYLLLGKYYAF